MQLNIDFLESIFLHNIYSFPCSSCHLIQWVSFWFVLKHSSEVHIHLLVQQAAVTYSPWNVPPLVNQHVDWLKVTFTDIDMPGSSPSHTMGWQVPFGALTLKMNTDQWFPVRDNFPAPHPPEH